MASLPISIENFKLLKAAVSEDLGNIPCSGHLDECLAAALGYKTYAAFRADLRDTQASRIQLLNESAFETRMKQFCPDLCAACDWWLGFDSISCSVTIKTVSPTAHENEYKSRRAKAWRNLMVAAVNAALRQKMFGILPGHDAVDPEQGGLGYFHFELLGQPVLGYVQEAGFDELSVYAMLRPTKKARQDILWEHNDASSGSVWARCWFERRTGTWIQSSTRFFRCQRAYLNPLANLAIEPQGYGDRGNVIM